MMTTASGAGTGVQNANSEMADMTPAETNMFHTPNLSARMPETARPIKDPAWSMATAYDCTFGEVCDAEASTGALKYGESQLQLVHELKWTRQAMLRYALHQTQS